MQWHTCCTFFFFFVFFKFLYFIFPYIAFWVQLRLQRCDAEIWICLIKCKFVSIKIMGKKVDVAWPPPRLNTVLPHHELFFKWMPCDLNSVAALKLISVSTFKEKKISKCMLFFSHFVQKKLSVALFLFLCIYVDTLW